MKKETKTEITSNCTYYVLWCPKYRRKVLSDGIDVRLKNLIKEICNAEGLGLHHLEVAPDNVQMLLEVSPLYGIHKAIKHIKSRTSHVLRQEFPRLNSRLPTLWSNSYYISTIGSVSEAEVEDYIKNQRNG